MYPAKRLKHPVQRSHALTEGKTHENVLLEMYLAEDGSGKRLRPLNIFPADIKVEFQRSLSLTFHRARSFELPHRFARNIGRKPAIAKAIRSGRVKSLRASDGSPLVQANRLIAGKRSHSRLANSGG